MSSAASYGCVYFDRRCFRKDDVKSSKGRKLYVCNSVASTPQGLQFANTKVQIPEKTVRIGVLGASGYTGSEDAEVPWHLIAIAIFFTLLKLPGPILPLLGAHFCSTLCKWGIIKDSIFCISVV